MSGASRFKPSPSMVVSLIALFVALSGASYAAIKANSVGSKQLKQGAVGNSDLAANSVDSSKVADNSLTTSDIDESTLQGIQGPQGPQGAQGPPGEQGPQGIQGPPGDDATINGVNAGGDLSGTYPNPTIAPGSLGSLEVIDNDLTGDDIAEGSLDSSVLQRRVAPTCGNNEAIRAIGADGTVTCETDDAGGAPSGAAGGDLAGTYPNPSIAANAVTSPKVQDNSLSGVDVENGSLNGFDVQNDSLDGFDVTNLDGGSIAGGQITASHLASALRPIAFNVQTQDFQTVLAEIGELRITGQCFWQNDLAQASLIFRTTGQAGTLDVVRSQRSEQLTESQAFIFNTNLDPGTNNIITGSDAVDGAGAQTATTGISGLYTSASRTVGLDIFETADDGGASGDGSCRFRGLLTPAG